MTNESQMPPAPPSGPPSPPPSEPPASPPAGGSGVSENRQLWIVLSYLWLLALIPFLVEKEDKEALWHSRHGLVLTGAEIVIWVAMWILSTILGPLFCVGCVVQVALFVAILAVRVFCITKGLNGERFLIPGLSELADRF